MSDKSINKGALYLIPCPISEEGMDTIPSYVQQKALELSVFVCERIRTTRRYLKKIDKSFDIDGAEFIEMEKKGDNKQEIREVLALLNQGKDVGLLSEAGCPCIADPGYLYVQKAHDQGISVRPLVGPSSIFLALMASGLNGQQFMFHGYLPVKEPVLIKKLNHISGIKATHIFIETPYRNRRMFSSLTSHVKGHVKLCIASGISEPHERIMTKTIDEWKKEKGELFEEKIPAIFLLGMA